MTPPPRDPFALDGKLPAPESRFEVVVVGAGPAGIAAAIAAAQGGAGVLLVDENPVPAATMGLDVPLFFGGRMTGAVQNRDRMLEQVVGASPGLAEAFELGVEVALGTCAWGVFVRGYGLQALPGRLIGLADEDRAWMVGFDRLILAAGARDLPLAFPGWDQPGVMGAVALHSLMTRYHAFSGRRIVILGSDRLGLETALLALDRGLEVAALVEVRDQVQGPADLAEAVRASGVEILTGHVVRGAEGGSEGVERVQLAPVGEPRGAGRAITCDTICLAVGQVPSVELLGAAGAPLSPRTTLGGYTPTLAGAAVEGLADVFGAGDAAGLGLNEAAAEASGRHAAQAALASLGKADAPGAPPPNPGVGDAYAYQADWVRALADAGDESVFLCQCEEVSRAALLAVRQPAYLGPPSEGNPRRGRAGGRRPDQAPHPRRHGGLPGPALPRADRPDPGAGLQHPRRRYPPDQLPRAGAAPAAAGAGGLGRDRGHGRRLGRLVRHPQPMDPLRRHRDRAGSRGPGPDRASLTWRPGAPLWW
jgi:thioredoxin reductase